jgi:NAD(P)-dependent dehydrogenase (short-subunit alcohol dehydrogenase family)
VLITGATSGLGLGAAEQLARDPTWRVVITGRNATRTAEAAARIGAEPLTLDLASLDSVRRCAASLAGDGRPPLHALVANAGLQHLDGTVATADGLEETFAVNHLGHFLLIQLLLEQLVTPARVIIVASDTHDPAQSTGMPTPRYTTAADLARPDPAWARGDAPAVAGRRRYTTSKLCNVLLTYELQRRCGGRGITFNAFNPGLMPGTGLARDYPAYQRLAWRYVLPVLTLVRHGVNTPGQSASALVRLVTDPALADVSGRYFSGRESIDSSTESQDAAKAADLWETSLQLTGLPVTAS